MLNFKEIISVSLILFSVIDIIGSVPIIIDLRKRSGHVQSEKATIVSGILMFVFLFLGQYILQLFHIDIGSFAIAGALIIFLIGIEMVLGIDIFKPDTGEAAKSSSVVPLAFPLIAGAGTLTTLLALKTEYSQWNIVVGIIINLFFVYVVLKSSGWLEKKIGPGGFNVLRKVFGIILISIAIRLFKSNIVNEIHSIIELVKGAEVAG